MNATSSLAGHLRFVTLLLAPLMSLFLLASRTSAAEIPHPTPHEMAAIEATEGSRLWYHEDEFLRDPALRATPGQVVILHLAPASRGRRFLDHAIPYFFPETATFSFCIPKKDLHLQAFTLVKDGSKARVVHLGRGNQCKTRKIAAGFYRLMVRHDGARIDPDGKKAFIHVPRLKSSPLPLGFKCDPQPSLINPSFTFTAANGMFANIIPPNLEGQVQTHTTADTMYGWNICPDSNGNVTFSWSSYLNQDIAYMFASGPPSKDTVLQYSDKIKIPTPFKLTDRGNGQFSLAVNFSGNLYPVIVGTDNALNWASPGTEPAVFTINVKWWFGAVSPPIPPPQFGEVALYDACLNTGNGERGDGTWIFNTNIPDLGVYEIYGVPLDNIFESVKVGPLTQSVLYADSNYGGQAQLITNDIPCLSSTPIGFATSSIRLNPSIRDFLVATDRCLNCDLSGLDLSNLNLAGGKFQGSTFTGANLTSTDFRLAIFDDANLNGASTILTDTNLSGAIIHCTNFSGADLSSATFQSSGDTPTVTTDFSCRVDLTGANLKLSTFPLSQWRYFNLDGAKVNDLSDATLSTMSNKLDLSGAILSHMDMSNVLLDGANLGCATTSNGPICTQLIETSLTSASLKQATLVNALLQGCHLDFANLEGANLCTAKLNESSTTKVSATLQGAYLKNVNLAHADLTGANMANANFYSSFTIGSCLTNYCGATLSCASAVGATLNNADFTDAYLNGTDFSGATPQSVNFSGAFLAGANFTGANLSQDVSTGKGTNFTGAFLQGTNFTSPKSVTGANFTDAVIDLKNAQGANLLVQLDTAKNIAFPGYTPTPNSTPGCVEFSYSSETALPPNTDSTNLCPDGNIGPCSSPQWQSPKTPPPPLPANCTTGKADLNWTLD